MDSLAWYWSLRLQTPRKAKESMDHIKEWIMGWHYWEQERPPELLVKVWRAGWTAAIVCFPSELDPALNIAGLRWTLTGVAKERIESSGG